MGLFGLGLILASCFGLGWILSVAMTKNEEMPGVYLPSGETPPALPAPPVKSDAIVSVATGDGPYRTQGEMSTAIIPRPSVLPAGKNLKFSNFVRYWQCVGLPDEPWEDQNFIVMSQLLDFGSSKDLLGTLKRECAELTDGYAWPHDSEQQTLGRCFFAAIAVRNRPEDADLLVGVAKAATIFSQKYLSVRSVGQIWPVSRETVGYVASLADLCCDSSDDAKRSAAKLVRAAAKETLSSWREVDPVGYAALAQSLLQ